MVHGVGAGLRTHGSCMASGRLDWGREVRFEPAAETQGSWAREWVGGFVGDEVVVLGPDGVSPRAICCRFSSGPRMQVVPPPPPPPPLMQQQQQQQQTHIQPPGAQSTWGTATGREPHGLVSQSQSQGMPAEQIER